jgi:hypothetical protein
MNNNPLPGTAKYSDPTQLPAMLWLVEGNIPALYADPEGIPTIGIGVNITVPQNLAVVLSQISVNGENLFAAAAAQGHTVDQVLQAFETIVADNPLSKSNITRTGQTQEEMDLQDALDTQAGNYFNETLDVFRFGAPQQGTNPAIAAATATFANFPQAMGQNVLSILLSDTAQVIQ